jgi:uncharacterized alkaline shock family protein YloU
VQAVAKQVQEKVKEAVESMTGLNLTEVDISVCGVTFDKVPKAAKAAKGKEKEKVQ